MSISLSGLSLPLEADPKRIATSTPAFASKRPTAGDSQSMKGARVLESSVFQIWGDKMKFAEAAAGFDKAEFAEFELLLRAVLEAMGLSQPDT
jgi:hypothetical protein